MFGWNKLSGSCDGGHAKHIDLMPVSKYKAELRLNIYNGRVRVRKGRITD